MFEVTEILLTDVKKGLQYGALPVAEGSCHHWMVSSMDLVIFRLLELGYAPSDKDQNCWIHTKTPFIRAYILDLSDVDAYIPGSGKSPFGHFLGAFQALTSNQTPTRENTRKI